jgi:hypothetical protein
MKVKSIKGSGLLTFFCPGCQRRHMINHGGGDGPQWAWNGDYERPTFVPSVLVTYSGADAGTNGAPPGVCHSFVTNGQVQFLGDCTHPLVGQTVDLPDIAVAPTEEALS